MTDINTIISLCKRRGFIFPGSEIYGGLANSWDYGPLGVELKNNIKQLWWRRFVHERDDMVGIDAALIMNPKVWEASGHLKEFSDPLVECKECHSRFRADQLTENKCPNCGGEFTQPKQFNLMLKTYLGPAEEKANEVYFRPETAQAMFVDFKNVADSMRKRLPFGIAQIGKAFRNEITPGNFIFRMREFEQMEIEYFVREEDWQKYFDHWLGEMRSWLKELGVGDARIHEAEIPDGDRAHYSKRTVDFEYEYPFGQKELYGLAYRTNFDLKNHFPDGAPYRDPESGEEFWPHVIEPTWGVDRSVLVTLLEAYQEDTEKKRVYLKLPPKLAPYKVAVFPLLANKPDLVAKAREIYDTLRKKFPVAWDDRGNVGKRYYAQDEIGTPWCITVDFQSLEDSTVTVRDRDTGEQVRVSVADLDPFISERLV
ncbi:MAG: glycine--tRNA ligase [Candidatus Ryanbacteria bacterium RIFCSPHIGHO2_02_FULL_48_12]|uniref:Glycine--tRNA ligase n=1 Tax=Candidatus Ryanbacteria bacterium RIFCSPHIGHO2_01_FULL_48_27 TaxID=1802115 RepID=A0A1G2G3Z0_9BACT|nr:MAG: glycine--tRNA ligase [Candidatus Ryanbacteria bacterium RIFCSPHIGHO2_01_FULL_48_27]OGZ50732.1 MAG: glycine--tRNA ligase [Candidatus Ryanbacteria bacterium RIFCSPHIGHO2_02_FULL_48_12]